MLGREGGIMGGREGGVLGGREGGIMGGREGGVSSYCPEWRDDERMAVMFAPLRRYLGGWCNLPQVAGYYRVSHEVGHPHFFSKCLLLDTPRFF